MSGFGIRKSLLGAGALLVITTAATACTAATSTAPTTTPTRSAVTAASLPTIFTCTGQAVVRPSSIIVACADANTDLVDLRWSAWGSATTHATGTLQENDCTPNCATGHFISYRASVTLSGLLHGHYGHLRVVAPPAPDQPYDFTLTPSGPGG